jgi:FixJ family two-component response regulator
MQRVRNRSLCFRHGAGQPEADVIHIVEDDPGVNDSLTVLFHNMGFEVLSYRDANDFMNREPPNGHDTVVVDLMLPGIAGVSLIKWLQALRSPPRIVAISGQPQSVIDAQLHGVEVPHLVRKPVTDRSILALFS